NSPAVGEKIKTSGNDQGIIQPGLLKVMGLAVVATMAAPFIVNPIPIYAVAAVFVAVIGGVFHLESTRGVLERIKALQRMAVGKVRYSQITAARDPDECKGLVYEFTVVREKIAGGTRLRIISKNKNIPTDLLEEYFRLKEAEVGKIGRTLPPRFKVKVVNIDGPMGSFMRNNVFEIHIKAIKMLEQLTPHEIRAIINSEEFKGVKKQFEESIGRKIGISIPEDIKGRQLTRFRAMLLDFIFTHEMAHYWTRKGNEGDLSDEYSAILENIHSWIYYKPVEKVFLAYMLSKDNLNGIDIDNFYEKVLLKAVGLAKTIRAGKISGPFFTLLRESEPDGLLMQFIHGQNRMNAIRKSTILIVDNLEYYRSGLQEAFRKLGVQNVLVASSADEALEIIGKHKVDLLVTDLNMGSGGYGIKLILDAQNINSDLRAILMTHIGKEDFVQDIASNRDFIKTGARLVDKRGAGIRNIIKISIETLLEKKHLTMTERLGGRSRRNVQTSL
ncbi:MAG: response regulator, partial [Candidatus Omnitrophica bacterium]|nr:response regulator [Candidatus Omnitrophota bacterium]